MTFSAAVQYLDSFLNYENLPTYDYEALKLERIKGLCSRLGNPHLGLKCIHIAGTKGKGSTAAMIFSILKKSGYKVGLYTSPHLVSFRERIRINDELISEEAICSLLDKIKPAIDVIDKKSDMYPTFFEVYTALAFCYFKEANCDLCVLEVGLGGRLDATNIIENPLCCAITPISYEHTDKLGATLEQIASEKAGIIKENSICVSSVQQTEAMSVIRNRCLEKRCKLYELGKDIRYTPKAVDGPRQLFSVSGMSGEYPNLELGLLGEHQCMNAAAAIGVLESLRIYGIIIGPEEIREGLPDIEWPGRLQLISERPQIIVDGAQNRASAFALKKAVKKLFKYNKLILILGVSQDKDIKGICDELVPISDEVILTKATLSRAKEPAMLKEFVNKSAKVTNGVKEAFGIARDSAAPSDLILVAGSLYIVGEVMQLCKK